MTAHRRFDKPLLRLLSIFIAILGIAFQGHAEETTLIIRAKSKDAKFIGSSMGGAHIIVRDHSNGTILAEGLTAGGTGNTDIIMKQPHRRNAPLTDDHTAFFKAVIDIDKPVFVRIEAYGPINARQATVLSTTQLWIIPGKDILGDGIILEIPGFVVDLLPPEVTASDKSQVAKVSIMANVVMMCGCPITNGGLWDAEQYEVAAMISKDGNVVETVKLSVHEKASRFSGQVDLEAGSYEITVYAYDPATGNTGLDKTNLAIRE